MDGGRDGSILENLESLVSLSMIHVLQLELLNQKQLTYLIQLESFVLNFFLVKKPLDLRTEWTRGLGEHHDLVVLDVLIHHLDGRP